MINKVITAIKKYNMLNKADTVTVGLSGGADSVALLFVLLSLRDEYNITVKAAHLNHNLRGEESNRDEQFVRRLCEQKGVELFVKSVDINALAKRNKQSVELAARQARYEFFSSLGLVATAHNADDNAETVLLNLIRGTGTKGLCGIPPVRQGIIRPLILCSREQIEMYCEENKIEYVTDSTNLTDDYTRNKLRHNVLPVLKSINSGAVNNFSQSCEILRTEDEYLDRIAQQEYLKAVENDALVLSKLSTVDTVLINRILRRFVLNITGDAPDGYHTEQLCRLVHGTGKCQLKNGWYAAVQKGKLKLFADNFAIDFCVSTKKVTIDDYKKAVKINSLLLKNAIDCDKIVGDVKFRCREAGDEIKLNRRGTKSLKKLYNEAGIALNERDYLPVLADDSGVIWVHTLGVAQRVAVGSTTQKVLIINAEQKERSSLA